MMLLCVCLTVKERVLISGKYNIGIRLNNISTLIPYVQECSQQIEHWNWFGLKNDSFIEFN